jgi:hypothetical protein
MTLAGSEYLLQLSLLALSFAGFSATVVTLRQALGGELSGLYRVRPPIRLKAA